MPLASLQPMSLLNLWVQRKERPGAWRRMAAVLLVTAVLGHVNATWTQSAGTQTVTLLQGNIAQDQKFEEQRGVLEALAWYGQQLRARRAC